MWRLKQRRTMMTRSEILGSSVNSPWSGARGDAGGAGITIPAASNRSVTSSGHPTQSLYKHIPYAVCNMTNPIELSQMTGPSAIYCSRCIKCQSLCPPPPAAVSCTEKAHVGLDGKGGNGGESQAHTVHRKGTKGLDKTRKGETGNKRPRYGPACLHHP